MRIIKGMTTTDERKARKSLIGLTAEELAEATKEFDEPTDLSQDRELTPEERERFERSVARGHDPRVRHWLIPFDVDLLDRVEAEVKRRRDAGDPSANCNVVIVEAVKKLLDGN